MTANDLALQAALAGPAPATIDDVIATMQRIDDVLDNGDGLKWFNRLYLEVTQSVDMHPPDGGWQDPAWLLDLDVIFAGMYFSALASSISGAAAPGAWRALMDQRRTSGIDRIQFALAGMNAHINHDLAQALVKTAAARGIVPTLNGPQRADFEAVNQLLNTIMPRTLTELAVDTLGVLAQDTGKVGRLLAFWNMCAARDMAWDFGDQLRILPHIAVPGALRAQDQMTGVIGRAILAFR